MQVAFRLAAVSCNLFAKEIYGRRGGVGKVKESWWQLSGPCTYVFSYVHVFRAIVTNASPSGVGQL